MIVVKVSNLPPAAQRYVEREISRMMRRRLRIKRRVRRERKAGAK